MAAVSSTAATLLPQDCLLCGGAAGGLLCPACAGDLPRLPDCLCPVCAEAVPAPGPCGACLKKAPAFDATVAAYRYGFPVDKLIQALKYGHRLAVADLFAAALLAGPRPAGDLLIALPLSRQRLRQRGFNQAAEIARALARTMNLPLDLGGCARALDTPPQAALPWPARRKNVRHAFECALDLTDRQVIVVDDVMTSGATLAEFAGVLKARGAARVTNWVAARALRD